MTMIAAAKSRSLAMQDPLTPCVLKFCLDYVSELRFGAVCNTRHPFSISHPILSDPVRRFLESRVSGKFRNAGARPAKLSRTPFCMHFAQGGERTGGGDEKRASEHVRL